MSSTTSLFHNPALPGPAAAWDANIWPEYPPVRYWHDLAYKPSRRPFYPFVHASITVPPRLRRWDVPIQERKALSTQERHWRETQEYWWNWNNEHSNGNIMEQTVSKNANGENKRQTWTAIFASLAIESYNFALSIAACRRQPMLSRPIPKENIFSTLLELLALILFIGFCASIVVMVASLLYIGVDGLFLHRYGNLGWLNQSPTIWYENVPCVRGWAVASPNSLGSVLLRHHRPE